MLEVEGVFVFAEHAARVVLAAGVDDVLAVDGACRPDALVCARRGGAVIVGDVLVADGALRLDALVCARRGGAVVVDGVLTAGDARRLDVVRARRGGAVVVDGVLVVDVGLAEGVLTGFSEHPLRVLRLKLFLRVVSRSSRLSALPPRSCPAWRGYPCPAQS